MKNHPLKKLLSLALALVMVIGLLPFSAMAMPEADVQTDEPAAEATHAMGRRAVDHPGGRSVTEAYLASKQADSADGASPKTDFPSSYNSNTLGCVTPVRNQGNYGTCWAHGALGSVESYMIKHGVVNGATGAAAATSMNLSEYHLSWYNYTYAYDKLGMLSGDNSKPYSNYLNLGGFGEMATYTLMRWEGPASETTAALAYSKASTSGLGSTYAYDYNIAHVQEVEWIPTANMDAIKAAIMEYGAGTFGYCHEDNYSNDSTGAYCYIQSAAYGSDNFDYSNHDVTVVGWDDNYSRTNFNSRSRPTNNGAWIIKNSWGTSYGNSGYYYISYEDSASLNDICYFYKVENLDNYDNIYQYDGTNNFSSYQTFSSNNPYVATTFTANGSETLKAVALCTWDEGVSYTVKIYTDLTSSTNPASGTLAAAQTGSFPYMGYHTVVLDTPVTLSANQTYSVVFQLSTTAADDSGNYLNVPYDYSGSSSQYVTWTHTTHSNTSFYKNASASSWTSTGSGKGNFRIKAYTVDYTAPAYNISAVSNNTAWGTVSLNGSVITASPAAGYYAAGYTVTSGAAAVTQSGNSFTVVPSSDCTVRIDFAPKQAVTVTYLANGSQYATASGYAGDEMTLLSSAAEVEGWTFCGWSEAVISDTTEKPSFYEPGAAYTPNADVTLYAVYRKTEGGDQPSNQYALFSGDLEAGDYLVVYGTSAMAAAISNNRLAYETVSPENDVITTSDESLIWTLSSENIGGLMYWRLFNNNAAAYAAATGSNNRATLLSSVTDYARWSVTVSDGTYDFQNKGNSRYLRCNGSYGFAAYASSTGGPLSLYKNVPAGTTTYTTSPVVEVPCAHDGTVTEIRVEPTCTENGSLSVICDLCGAVLSTQVLPAVGHTPAGTYSSDDDNHWHVCTVCGQSVGDEAVHVWGEGSVTTAPTPAEPGVMTYYCTVCEHEMTEPIPALGYDYTVTFSVFGDLDAVAPMVSNTNTGITLPAAESPDSYTFLGWVLTDYEHVTECPEEILTGAWTAPGDVTLLALFSYAGDDMQTVSGYYLVTDPAQLSVGDSIVITANGTKNNSLSTTQNNNNRGSVDGVKSDDYSTFTPAEETAILTVKEGAVTGTLAFYDPNLEGYLYAASSFSNYLRTKSELDANGSWLITISNGEATVIAQGSNSRNILRYNSQNDLFSCYSTGQQSVFLYRYGVVETSTQYYTTVPVQSGPDLSFVNTLSLESDTSLNYYVKKDAVDEWLGDYGLTVGSLRFVVERTLPGEDEPEITTFTQPRITSKGGVDYYVYSFPNIAAKQLNLAMRAYLEFTADGETVRSPERVYNPISYCYQVGLNDGNNLKLRKACADLILYAAAAQTYFAYNLDCMPDTAEAGWNDVMDELATNPDVEASNNYSKGENGSVLNIATVTLALEGRVEMNVKMTPVDLQGVDLSSLKLCYTYTDISGVTVSGDIGYSDWSYSGGQYIAVFAEQSAGEIFNQVTFCVVQTVNGADNVISNEYKISVSDYAANVISLADSNTFAERLAPLMHKLLNYGASAYDYFRKS